MNKIYVTGDRHGNIVETLSYNHNPYMRKLDSTDVLVIVGDIGVMWPGYEKNGKYELEWLNSRPYKSILLRGNHDNKVWFDQCEFTNGCDNIKLLCGDMRQAQVSRTTFENLYLVSDTAYLNINGSKCLCIGGAESTDNMNLCYPWETSRIRDYKKRNVWYRVVGKSWWADEKINIPYFKSLFCYYAIWDEDVDYVFSHQAPSNWCDSGLCYRADRRIPNDEQNFLYNIAKQMRFTNWYHGHMHDNATYDNKYTCLYDQVIEAGEKVL